MRALGTITTEKEQSYKSLNGGGGRVAHQTGTYMRDFTSKQFEMRNMIRNWQTFFCKEPG